MNKNKTCIVNCNKSYRELPFQLSTEKLHMLLFFSIIQCDSVLLKWFLKMILHFVAALILTSNIFTYYNYQIWVSTKRKRLYILNFHFFFPKVSFQFTKYKKQLIQLICKIIERRIFAWYPKFFWLELSWAYSFECYDKISTVLRITKEQRKNLI